jgi:hypothetical protein
MDAQHPPEAIKWAERLSEFAPAFMANHPALSRVCERGDLVLGGSTSLGVDDEFSDLDLELALSDEDAAAFDEASPTRYIDFTLDGKLGSILVTSFDEWDAGIDACDMPLISELRNAIVLSESVGAAGRLISKVRQPMKPEVSQAFFFYHYFELRSFHRSGDNPMNRDDGVAAYMNSAQALAHGLRACLSLDGQPYPYEKWLWSAASRTPTGQLIAPAVNRIMDHLASDALRFPGPESENPLSLELKGLRNSWTRPAPRASTSRGSRGGGSISTRLAPPRVAYAGEPASDSIRLDAVEFDVLAQSRTLRQVHETVSVRIVDLSVQPGLDRVVVDERMEAVRLHLLAIIDVNHAVRGEQRYVDASDNAYGCNGPLRTVMLRPQAKHLGPRREPSIALSQILRLRSG